MVIDFDTRRRFKLRLPVIFRWSDGGNQIEGGFTEYVSRHAVWVLSERSPPPGSEVRFEVLIPAPDATVGLLRVRGVGTVIRIFNENEFSGFLFQGEFDDDHSLEDAGGPEPAK